MSLVFWWDALCSVILVLIVALGAFLIYVLVSAVGEIRRG